MMYIDGYMYEMQIVRLRESLIQNLLIFNDLTSNGVWKYGHTNETKRMCHRWKNKTWGKWLRARPFVVYDAIVQRYVHCN